MPRDGAIKLRKRLHETLTRAYGAFNLACSRLSGVGEERKTTESLEQATFSLADVSSRPVLLYTMIEIHIICVNQYGCKYYRSALIRLQATELEITKSYCQFNFKIVTVLLNIEILEYLYTLTSQ